VRKAKDKQLQPTITHNAAAIPPSNSSQSIA
jgi:hypothetical protein